MTEIVTVLKVGQVPDFNGQKFGKLQISSRKLAELVGKQVVVKVIVEPI